MNLIGKRLDVRLGPDRWCTSRATLTLALSQWFPTSPQQEHCQALGRSVTLLLIAAFSILLSYPLSARALPTGDPVEEQVLAQRKKIEQTIVEPCKSERKEKAAQIQRSIDACKCSSAEKQQNTHELDATLQTELRRCEEKGTDALDKFKHALVAFPPLEVGKALPAAWLRQFKSEGLRNWIRANVVCRRESLSYDKYGIAATDQLVIIPEVFNALDENQRINILAFELGKVFYQRVVAASPSRIQIRNNFSSDEIEEMSYAEYHGVSLRGQTPHSLNIDDRLWEGSSGFGYVFRAELLQIPSGNADWKRTQTEFHAIIDPVVRTAGSGQ